MLINLCFEQGQLRSRSALYFTYLGGCALSESADTSCRCGYFDLYHQAGARTSASGMLFKPFCKSLMSLQTTVLPDHCRA